MKIRFINFRNTLNPLMPKTSKWSNALPKSYRPVNNLESDYKY